VQVERRPRPLSARSLLEEIVVPRLERGEITFVLSDPAAGDGTAGARAAESALPELPSGFLSPRHAHGAHEVCWVVEGRCVLAVEARALDIVAGDACVVRPGEVHQLRPTASLEPFDTLWWHVTDRGVNLSLAGFAGDRYAVRGGFVTLSPSPVPALARVVQELEGARPRRDLLVRALLLEIAAALLRHLDEIAAGSSVSFTTERKSSWHVQRVAQYIETHHGSGITLENLARVAELSPYYLTRLFRDYTGRGVMAYLGDVRHREALALLRDTDLAVAEVARTVGYDDPYYFSRVFKSREGYAPLYYRRRSRDETRAHQAQP
jgi:AraC-like DNA-binding protein/mannose-6-phosphate isomerase-like protein (cupin superfamily)